MILATARCLHACRPAAGRWLSTTAVARAKTLKPSQKLEPKDKWNYNPNPFDGTIEEDASQLQLVTANALEEHQKPPNGVKMLVRDFIEDSLYNPNYGYFPKQATIFDTEDITFDFPKLRDSAEFQEEVGAKYAAYGNDRPDGPGRQLWHTPTELFKVRRRVLWV